MLLKTESYFLCFSLPQERMISFALALIPSSRKRRCRARKTQGCYCIFVVWAFSCRRSKTIRIRWTEPKPTVCSLCLSPSLYPDFKRSLSSKAIEAPVLAFKEPENEPKTIQFLKILLEKPAPRTAPLSHNTFTFHALLIRKSPTKILPTGL